MRFKRKDETGRKSAGITYAEAVDAQRRLARRVVPEFPHMKVRTVAGADVAFARDGRVAIAGFVAFSWPKLEIVDVSVAAAESTFPYIPGLLSFREIPVLAKAFKRLSARPDVLFCDAHGRAHPRRFGLASHLGVVLAMPTIGCAKSILVGEVARLGAKRGSSARIVDTGETVGKALRTRDNVKPLYVSTGNMMDIATAVRMVLAAARGYRIPEPTRQAHILVSAVKRMIEEDEG